MVMHKTPRQKLLIKKLTRKAKLEREILIQKFFESAGGERLVNTLKAKVTRFVKKRKIKDKHVVEKWILKKILKNVFDDDTGSGYGSHNPTTIIKMVRNLRENGQAIGLSSQKLREKASLLVRLRDIIYKKLFEQDSDNEDVDSILDDYDSEECLDDQVNIENQVLDLESIDSNSESESFQEWIESINAQFRAGVNKLADYLNTKIEAMSSSESENEEMIVESRAYNAHEPLIKQEVT